MTTWLDVGNGWRNLFLLSCALQAFALGLFFCARRLMGGKSRAASFLAGVACTPFVQYLWTLFLALVWPHAPKAVYIGVLPALAVLTIAVMGLRRIRRFRALGRRGWAFARHVFRFDKPSLMTLCFALSILLLLAPSLVRLMSSMNAASPADSGEYLALGLRYCEQRDLGELTAKEDTDGHFRPNSHFPSMELYNAHALMHTGENYGYPYDKPAFTALGLNNFYLIAAYLALLLVLCRERKGWVLLGLVLMNLVPNLYYAFDGAIRDVWRILALLLAGQYFFTLRLEGTLWKFTGKLVCTLLVCFTVMSAHVVCFVVLPFIVIAFVLWRWLEAGLRAAGSALRTLARSMGLAVAAAVGTLAAFAGNLYCYFKWGEMSPRRLMVSFTEAPWYSLYMAGEYKLEETTTTLNFWQAKNDIVMAYATPIGLWGLRLALLGLMLGLGILLFRRMKRNRPALFSSSALSPLCFASLLCLCTLAPMTGLLDTPIYSFSGSFLTMQRYTLQWFLFANVLLCSFGAFVQDVWPPVWGWMCAKLGKLEKLAQNTPFLPRLPLLLCAALSVLLFWQGTQQTGYSCSVYRQSRALMENEQALLDNGFLLRNDLLAKVAPLVSPEQKIVLTRAGTQYILHGNGYILTSDAIVPLMNLPLQEVPQALEDMDVAVVVTEPNFWDERYYSHSTLSVVLNALPPEQIFEDGTMRLYVVDPIIAQKLARLIPKE